MNTQPPLVSFGLIGDPQYADRPPMAGRCYRNALALLAGTVERLNREKLDFVAVPGDLGDGLGTDEIARVIRVLDRSRAPVRYAAGNHDFVLHTEQELARLFNVETLFYNFAVNGVRFHVLNSLEVSRFSPPGSERARLAAQYRSLHPELLLRDWDGMLAASSRLRLRRELEMSRAAGEISVILCHVPVYSGASGDNAVAWDSAELLELFDGFDHLKACFAGHYHPGGCAIRNGVLHKTVRAICNAAVPTAVIARVYPDRIELEGIGEESDACHPYHLGPATIRGEAPPGAVVMADSGELAEAGPDGRFELTVPAPGRYALKAVASGMADAFVPMVQAPAEGVRIAMPADPRRRLVRGDAGGPATLRITEGGRPVRWFDLAGNGYGGAAAAPGVWNEYCDRFWTSGRYAFSATGPVEQETGPYHPELRRRGWFKGDFHAHLIHGENTYRANLPFAAFLARAEHYDWLYLAAGFANDGALTDHHRLVRRLSTPDFLLRLNTEFPKNCHGHIGNAGVGPEFPACNPEAATNLELARRMIHDRGGVAVPVHPLYEDGIRRDKNGRAFSWMSGKELLLWLLCAPDITPCLDLFYNDDTPGAAEFWFMLLNRGYRIGCTATSDAAFDVGRPPGLGRGSTFIQMPELSEAGIVQGLRERRTMVSWDGAALLFGIDGHGPGTILKPTGKHRLQAEIFYRPDRQVELRIIRCGRLFERRLLKLPADGRESVEFEFEEHEDSWYLALLQETAEPGRLRSAASPVYFRTPHFREPEILPLPVPFPRELRDWMKYLTVKELTRPESFDELKRRLRKFLSDSTASKR